MQKDYLGKAVNYPMPVYKVCSLTMSLQKLVAASDPNDVFTTFSGSTRLKQGISPSGVFIDRPGTESDVSPTVTRSASVPPSAAPSRKSKIIDDFSAVLNLSCRPTR